MLKKFLLGLSLSLPLLFSTPAFAECEYPQARIETKLVEQGMVLWTLNPSKVKIFTTYINQVQDIQFDADQVIFAVPPRGVGDMKMIFLKNGCAVGGSALLIPPQILFKIFVLVGVGEHDFTQMKVGAGA